MTPVNKRSILIKVMKTCLSGERSICLFKPEVRRVEAVYCKESMGSNDGLHVSHQPGSRFLEMVQTML